MHLSSALGLWTPLPVVVGPTLREFGPQLRSEFKRQPTQVHYCATDLLVDSPVLVEKLIPPLVALKTQFFAT